MTQLQFGFYPDPACISSLGARFDYAFRAHVQPPPQVDSDGVGDACDACPGFDDTLDGDGIPDDCDLAGLISVCPSLLSPQVDRYIYPGAPSTGGMSSVEIALVNDVTLAHACTQSVDFDGTAGTPPTVTGLVQLGGGIHEVQLSGSIEPAAWTRPAIKGNSVSTSAGRPGTSPRTARRASPTLLDSEFS